MNHTLVERPLLPYLHGGISAGDALKLLNEHDTLTFPQLKSGLFPAANFDDVSRDETGMADAWLRDSACVGMALQHAGYSAQAKSAVEGVLLCLNSIEQSFTNAIAASGRLDGEITRPPVRFTGETSEPLYSWANAQNDALGYSLQCIGQAVDTDLIELTNNEKASVELAVLYLEAIRYWEDEDSGHWEEIKKVNASSIGTVVSGLRAVRGIFSDSTKLTALIENGTQALAAILPAESKTTDNERLHDGALLFLAEPHRAVSDEVAATIISQVEENLMGEYGIRRYAGDSYWGPNYREHFPLGVRTADFSNPEAMKLRDHYVTSGTEAQWTLFDPLLSMYYAHQYQKDGGVESANKAARFLVRALKSVIVHEKNNGEVIWRIPELFFLEGDRWVPNDHLGLLWAQANLLQALRTYEEVFADTLIQET